MGMARIWVYRRHLDYPSVSIGLQLVEEQIAEAMIVAHCAQDWQTDQRKLISPSVSRPPVPETAPKAKRGRPRKASTPTESTPPSEDGEIEPSQADVDEAPRYRRRDLRAEK